MNSQSPGLPPSSDDERFAKLALADDAESLNPESDYNLSFRDSGVGFVPPMLAKNDAAKSAAIGCASIEAIVTIPFGWHAVDDGSRTLIFDQANNIQINLNLMDFKGEPFRNVIDSLVKANLEAYPGAEYVELSFGEDQPGLAFRNMIDDGALLQQVFIWRATPHRPQIHMQIRVTAETNHMDKAMSLLEILAEFMLFPPGE